MRITFFIAVIAICGCLGDAGEVVSEDRQAYTPKGDPLPGIDCKLFRLLNTLDGTCFKYVCGGGIPPHIETKPIGWDCAYREDFSSIDWKPGVCAPDGVCAPLQ